MIGRVALALTLGCALFAHADSTPNNPPRLSGTVTEQGTRKPLFGVDVLLIDDRGGELGRAVTDDKGHFAIAFANEIGGAVTVVLATGDHKLERWTESLKPGERLEVAYALRRKSYALFESTVRGAPTREEIARINVTREEVLPIAGMRGDLLGAVLNLPSVARSPYDAGQLIIRGAEPYESGAFLGGISIPQPFHFGVGTSTFNSYLLDHFEFIPSNFSVRFGRLIGGVVDLVPRSGQSDRIHVDAKVDILEAHLIVEGPIKEGTFALALRRSYIDTFLSALVPAGSVTVAPRYYDYQGLFEYPVLGGRFRLIAYGSDDALGLVESGDGASLFGPPNQRFWFHSLTASYLKKWQGDEVEATLSSGPQHAETSGDASGSFTQDLIEIDARLEVRHRVFHTLKITGGFDFQSRYSWLHLSGPPVATEDQIQIPGAVANLTLASQRFMASPAAYLQFDWQLSKRFSLVGGVRADWFADKPGTYVEPRLMARFEVAPATFLKAGAGLFYQPPQAPLDDPTIGNPALRPEQAIHLLAGVETRPIRRLPSLSFEANLFYKDLRNLAVASNDYALRDGQVRPLLYSDEGIGRVYGGDVFIRQASPRWLFGWISYSLMRSERMDHPGTDWRPFRFDQTHILTFVVGYHLPWDIDVGARFRYATGNPDTDLLSSSPTFDSNANVFLPHPAALFSSRLPDFVQLDVRVDKRFVFRTWILSVYLDAYNVTNQQTVEGYSYSYDYTHRIPAAGLPIIPSFGLRGSF